MIFSRDRSLGEVVRTVRRSLGFFASLRFKKLASYDDGWDGDDARQLELTSANLFSTFIRAYGRFETTPSIFLNRNGYLSLQWENSKGRTINIKFDPVNIILKRETSSDKFGEEV